MTEGSPLMSKRWHQLQETLGDVAGRLDQLERRAEKMETILMVREPSSTVAADAYEGLRKQVVTAVADRLAHLAQLVQLDAALSRGADAGSLAKVVAGWVEQASLARVTDPGAADGDLLFALVEDLGGPAELVEPAYVDTVTGRVIRQGKIRKASPPPRAETAAGAAAGPAPDQQAGDDGKPAGRPSGRPEEAASADAAATDGPATDAPATGAPEPVAASAQGAGAATDGAAPADERDPAQQGDQAVAAGEGTQ